MLITSVLSWMGSGTALMGSSGADSSAPPWAPTMQQSTSTAGIWGSTTIFFKVTVSRDWDRIWKLLFSYGYRSIRYSPIKISSEFQYANSLESDKYNSNIGCCNWGILVNNEHETLNSLCKYLRAHHMCLRAPTHIPDFSRVTPRHFKKPETGVFWLGWILTRTFSRALLENAGKSGQIPHPSPPF